MEIEIRDKRRGFLWISNEFFDAFIPQLQPSSVIVYLALARLANNDSQTCFPSYEKISEMTGLSRASVATALSDLKGMLLIDWDNSQGKNVYYLLEVNSRLIFGPPIPSKICTEAVQNLDPNNTKEQDSYIERENSLFKEVEPKSKSKFSPPTIDSVRFYAKQIGSQCDPDEFFDHFTANGWKTNAGPMKDWQAAFRNWNRRSRQYSKGNGNGTYAARETADEARARKNREAIRRVFG